MNTIYFVGAGGIGMSNLVRYYLAKGYRVAGYDKTPSALTEKLIEEGAEIFYEESPSLIPEWITRESLIVRTPAIPELHEGLRYFLENGFRVIKRAQLLGEITCQSRSLCFSGTHGKTTTSSMAAHILHQSSVKCSAFLGGILKPYNSNLLLSLDSNLTVIEADEYDRSFHTLSPYMAVITSADPDHLDIYGDEASYLESFNHFTSLIQPNGVLIMKEGLKVVPRCDETVRVYSYSKESGDFHAERIRFGNGTIMFDFVTPEGVIEDISLGVPVDINIENSIAAMSVAWLNGVGQDELRDAIASYGGTQRRFDVHYKSDKYVLVDDYGHHPCEVLASITSVKKLYPEKRLTVIFQPHLFSRTNDFYREFAEALSLADEVYLLDIYPARELPMPGVTSQLIFDLITLDRKEMVTLVELCDRVSFTEKEVILTLGAGNIDTKLSLIKSILEQGE